MTPEARQQWVERLRRGDHAAFAKLVTEETSRLLAVLRRILRSEEEAKDCLQDVYLAAFRGLPDFQGEASVSTWLHRIAVNVGLMRIRSLGRRKEDLLEEGVLVGVGVSPASGCEPLQWHPVDPETAVADRQISRFVLNGLDQISEEHRSVIMLRDFEDLDTAQAAEKLGTSPDALKMRLHRARASLREVLISARADTDTVRRIAKSSVGTEVAAA